MQVQLITHFFVYYRFSQYSEQKKIKIYRTLTKPVETYRAESWTLNTDIAKWLDAFDRRVLRKMFGGIKVNENWRK